MDAKSSWPLIVRRRALPAVKRTIKAQIAIVGELSKEVIMETEKDNKF